MRKGLVKAPKIAQSERIVKKRLDPSSVGCLTDGLDGLDARVFVAE